MNFEPSVNNEKNVDKFTSGGLVAKNTFYNLLGYGIPILVALLVIPKLISILGIERFGILNLVWIVIGYFSFFDFGIGRTLTKLIAEKIGNNKTSEIPSIFWTSFIIMLLVSVVGAVSLKFIVPYLVKDVFIISKELKQESLETFYLLTLSIPIVTTTAGLRGVLEAYQDFGIVNVIRVLLGIFTFLGPLLCLLFVNSLFWIVAILIIIRVVIWFLYFIRCLRINKFIRKEIKFNFALINPILKLGGWITVANIIAPLLIFSDRFFIGSLVSATAVTYYATPYEVITKLLLIPGALVTVLFPIFSASFNNNPEFSKKLFLSGTKFIFLILYPIVFLVITFSFQGIEFWLGTEFAEKSSFILQLLAFGVLLNGLAAVPFNFFQGIGKPKIPALINLIELPFYLVAMLIIIKRWGINGAVIVWFARVALDAAILFMFTHKKVNLLSEIKNNFISFILMLVVLIFAFLFHDLVIKIVFVIVVLSGFILITWNHLLEKEEKSYMISILKKVGNYS